MLTRRTRMPNPWRRVPRVLGERRVLDIINELETMGFISGWNVSKGRYGYQKMIKLNTDPHTIMDFYMQKYRASNRQATANPGR